MVELQLLPFSLDDRLPFAPLRIDNAPSEKPGSVLANEID